MTADKYPRRAIALGPPYDDGTYWDADGVRHQLAEPETGAAFVARVIAENRRAVHPIRARMEMLDSKGHRIGWRVLNGGRRRP